jgi:hypothetical protein
MDFLLLSWEQFAWHLAHRASPIHGRRLAGLSGIVAARYAHAVIREFMENMRVAPEVDERALDGLLRGAKPSYDGSDLERSAQS